MTGTVTNSIDIKYWYHKKDAISLDEYFIKNEECVNRQNQSEGINNILFVSKEQKSMFKDKQEMTHHMVKTIHYDVRKYCILMQASWFFKSKELPISTKYWYECQGQINVKRKNEFIWMFFIMI